MLLRWLKAGRVCRLTRWRVRLMVAAAMLPNCLPPRVLQYAGSKSRV